MFNITDSDKIINAKSIRHESYETMFNRIQHPVTYNKLQCTGFITDKLDITLHNLGLVIGKLRKQVKPEISLQFLNSINNSLESYDRNARKYCGISIVTDINSGFEFMNTMITRTLYNDDDYTEDMIEQAVLCTNDSKLCLDTLHVVENMQELLPYLHGEKTILNKDCYYLIRSEYSQRYHGKMERAYMYDIYIPKKYLQQPKEVANLF